MSEYSVYVSEADRNFNISPVNLREAVSVFDSIDDEMTDMREHLRRLPDLTSKDAFYFVTAFLLLARRQMRNAFTLFMRRMSYDGLLLSRVALESTVFAYRVFKNMELI